jgi:quinol monooxygenase YgiN
VGIDGTATVVQIAEIEVDPAQLEAFSSAVKEEMEAAVRLEPGVLAIYAVADKSDPGYLRFFEIYASEDDYRVHRETEHFKKYLAITGPMVRSRRLLETVPIQLSSKASAVGQNARS